MSTAESTNRCAGPSAHTDSSAAWSLFWQEQGPASRCLAGASPEIHQLLQHHWASFATTLSPTAVVLDLGCGGGAVGRSLLAHRGGINVVGVDIADVPKSGDNRIRLLSRTRMESLPCASRSCDAAVSQFGLEYGRVSDAATELARVLMPGAPFSLVLHHSESPICRENRVWRSAVEAFLSPRVEAAFNGTESAALHRAVSALQSGYPGLRIIEEGCGGIRAHMHRSASEKRLIWAAVVEALKPELVMARDLEAACIAPHAIDDWLSAFGEPLEIKSRYPLLLSSGEPLAWAVTGSLRRSKP